MIRGGRRCTEGRISRETEEEKKKKNCFLTGGQDHRNISKLQCLSWTDAKLERLLMWSLHVLHAIVLWFLTRLHPQPYR